MSRKGLPFPSIFDRESGLFNGLRETRGGKFFFWAPSRRRPKAAPARDGRSEGNTESDFHEEIVAFSRLAGQERKAPWPLAPRDRAPYSNRALRSRPESAAGYSCAHRLAVQDVALSRRKHGFESRWARQ